jgi:hypothetical protein
MRTVAEEADPQKADEGKGVANGVVSRLYRLRLVKQQATIAHLEIGRSAGRGPSWVDRGRAARHGSDPSLAPFPASTMAFSKKTPPAAAVE